MQAQSFIDTTSKGFDIEWKVRFYELITGDLRLLVDITNGSVGRYSLDSKGTYSLVREYLLSNNADVAELILLITWNAEAL